MKKLILVNGDIATGKSHLAGLLHARFHLTLFTKDEFKERLAETNPYSTYEENHRLSILAMEMLVGAFTKVASTGEDLILEANFHKEHLDKIAKIAAKHGYFILNLNLFGSPEVLFQRYVHRRDHEERHPVHAINRLNDFESFKQYTLNRQKEEMIGVTLSINADDFAYQSDESLLSKIEAFLNTKPILETDRLMLREMTDVDYDSLAQVITDPINMKYYSKPYDEEGVLRWLNWCKSSYKKYGFGLWSVILKENGMMIGDCGVSIQPIDDGWKPEIGYHLNRAYHQRGIGKEMTQAVKDYFFTRFDFDEVYSYMNQENLPSYKTAEANGMTFLHLYKTSDGETCRVYRITRQEWGKQKK